MLLLLMIMVMIMMMRVGVWNLCQFMCVFTEATDSTGFAAVKLTALGRPQLLVQLLLVTFFNREFVISYCRPFDINLRLASV